MRRAVPLGLLAVSLLGGPVAARDDGQVARQTNKVTFHIDGMS